MRARIANWLRCLADRVAPAPKFALADGELSIHSNFRLIEGNLEELRDGIGESIQISGGLDNLPPCAGSPRKRAPRIPGINADADALNVCRSHLYRVLAGKRHSRSLLAKYHALQRTKKARAAA